MLPFLPYESPQQSYCNLLSAYSQQFSRAPSLDHWDNRDTQSLRPQTASQKEETFEKQEARTDKEATCQTAIPRSAPDAVVMPPPLYMTLGDGSKTSLNEWKIPFRYWLRRSRNHNTDFSSNDCTCSFHSWSLCSQHMAIRNLFPQPSPLESSSSPCWHMLPCADIKDRAVPSSPQFLLTTCDGCWNSVLQQNNSSLSLCVTQCVCVYIQLVEFLVLLGQLVSCSLFKKKFFRFPCLLIFYSWY